MRLTAPSAASCLAVLALAGCGGGGTTTIIKQAKPPAQQTTPSATSACGQVDFSGTPTTVVVLQGTTCSEAEQVARAYAVSSPPQPWQCALAHAPFESHPLPDESPGVVGYSCGYGGSGGDLRAAPHAFIGVSPAPAGTSSTPGDGSSPTAGPTASDAGAAAQQAASAEVSKFGIDYSPGQFEANCSSSDGGLTWSCTVDSGQCGGTMTIEFNGSEDHVGHASSRRVGCGE